MSTALFAGTVQTRLGGYDLAPVGGEELTGALRACLEEGRLLDRHGFDGILVAERHGRSECVAPDPIGLLAALAAVTDRALLGTYVHLGLLHHPIDVAERFAQLDALSGVRAVACLGAGYHPGYFALYGTDLAARLARLEELIELLRTAWSGGDLDIEWQGRRLVGPVHPRPVTGQIPVWQGAQFPKSSRWPGGSPTAGPSRSRSTGHVDSTRARACTHQLAQVAPTQWAAGDRGQHLVPSRLRR